MAINEMIRLDPARLFISGLMSSAGNSTRPELAAAKHFFGGAVIAEGNYQILTRKLSGRYIGVPGRILNA